MQRNLKKKKAHRKVMLGLSFKYMVRFLCTFPIKWRICSMIIEAKTSTKQTKATAQVGVSSRDRPPGAPPAINSLRSSSNYDHNLCFIYLNTQVRIENVLS